MISLVTLLYFLNLFITGSPSIRVLPHEEFATRDSFSFTFQNIIETILMIPPGISQVNGALWSLFIEWWLYISFMFVFMALHSGTRGKYAYGALSLLPLILAWYFDGKFRIIFYFIVWWIGAFYTLFFKNRARLMLRFRIAFYIFLAMYLIWFGIDGALIHVVNWRIYGLFQVIFSFCIIDAVTRCSLGSLMVSAGKFSYSLYILHFPLLLFAFSIFHNYMTNPAIKVIVPISTCIAILGIACWSAAFFENKKLFRDYFMTFVRRNA